MVTAYSLTTRKFYFLFFLALVGIIAFFPFFAKTLLGQAAFGRNQNIWPQVQQKLDATTNTFSLHSPVSFFPQAGAAADYENATAYIAIDETNGTILAEKNADAAVSIASLTKIMSSVVALDLAKPSDEMMISPTAPLVVPTKIGVVPGEKMTVAELLHGMLMTSANDAAQATADGMNAMYGQNIFVKAMNEKARFLGLTNTHFANPQGFDDANNKSSAHDLAILARYALSHYPLISQIAQEDYLQLPANTMHKQFDLYNWNGLLDVYPGVTGLKIGNTPDAGYTTIVTATRSGQSILVVLLGAPGILQRDMWTAELLDDTFASFGLSRINVTTTDLENKYATWHYWN